MLCKAYLRATLRVGLNPKTYRNARKGGKHVTNEVQLAFWGKGLERDKAYAGRAVMGLLRLSRGPGIGKRQRASCRGEWGTRKLSSHQGLTQASLGDP